MSESAAYHSELLRLIRSLIAEALRGYHPDLTAATGVLPGRQLPTSGTSGSGYPPSDGSVTIAKLAFDVATQAELDAESSARSAADSSLSGSISAESSARTAADSAHAALTTTAHGGIVASTDARLSDARTPTAHHASHQHGGSDELATATPAANAAPKAGAGGTLAAGWIPSLPASLITTGQLALARGGTNADLSATGGANQVVRQSSAGGALTVSALAAADIPALDSAKITTGEIPRSPLTTRGDLLTRDATTHSRLAIGTSGRYLRSNGTDPAWGQLDMADAAAGTLASARGGTGVGAIPAFFVHKNGTNQTGVVTSTFTLVTWSTEAVDSNNNFASNRFTPTIAGTYMITLAIYWPVAADQAYIAPSIYKNGVIYAQVVARATGVADQSSNVLAFVAMNGSTDYLEAYAYQSSGSNQSIDGKIAATFFGGAWIGP